MILRLIILIILLNIPVDLSSQKKLQRPSAGIGIKSIDSVVTKSFDLYNQLFDYEMRVNAGEVLAEEDICQIEEFSIHSEILAENALHVSSYLDTEGVLKRIKGTIQLQRAKRVLTYCRQTSKEIIGKQKPGS